MSYRFTPNMSNPLKQSIGANSLPFLPTEAIYMGNDFIIGMGVLRRYEVILDHGQRVIVNP